VVIAVTFQRLIEDAYREWTLEEELVLQALRRSTRTLETASAQELSDYLGSMSENQLRGVASNVKGIYHELPFVDGLPYAAPVILRPDSLSKMRILPGFQEKAMVSSIWNLCEAGAVRCSSSSPAAIVTIFSTP
jgi:hypothetical protein